MGRPKLYSKRFCVGFDDDGLTYLKFLSDKMDSLTDNNSHYTISDIIFYSIKHYYYSLIKD